VIDRIRKGRNVSRLLYYLFGPGKSDEHTDPHLVAGWRDPIVNLEPPVLPSGRRDLTRLSGLLNVPLAAAGREGQPGTVWHCVLSAAPGDRLLSDEEWNAIADEFMHQMGLARRDDPSGVRWVAVRHGLSAGGIDHVHIAATLARQDGGLPSVHNDFFRARIACQQIERHFGLTLTAPADHTAAIRPGRAETERSARTGRSEPPRITLRRTIQETAAIAVSEEDFFGRLRDAGVLIRERRSQTAPGRITGYAVGLAGHTNWAGEPVWYGGGKLAPDLTLPRLRRRWERSGSAERADAIDAATVSPRSARAVLRAAAERAADHARSGPGYFAALQEQGILVRYRYSQRNPSEVTGYAVALPRHQDSRGEPVWYSGGRLSAELTLPRLRGRWAIGGNPARRSPDPAERHALWADITRMTSDSARQFRRLAAQGQAEAGDIAAATADALRISAKVIKGPAAADLRRAASDFDRAAREAYGFCPYPTPAGNCLRTATRLLVTAATGKSPANAVAVFVANLIDLANATAELRHAQCRPHQAAAARAAASRLRCDATRQRPNSAHLTQQRRPQHLAADEADISAGPQQPRTRSHPTGPYPVRPYSRSRPHGPAP
jgi:hypothetical protein